MLLVALAAIVMAPLEITSLGFGGGPDGPEVEPTLTAGW